MLDETKRRTYLRDVLMLALSAFGGPFAHLALMQERLVERRQYLSNEELLELNALCQFLPGPTSTQTITAVGLKLGGQRLALLTLLLWILPACLLMTFLAVLVYSLEIKNLDMPPMSMVFEVKDPALLNKVKVGDKIVFTADQINGAYTVMSIDLPPAAQAR